MHSGNIENYNFTHGLHRNLISGKWFPLHPHTLGRALTHDEMDYNLLYSQQTLAGWRIFGKNNDLTLSDDELTKSLIFWKISATDTDYARYVAAGYTVDQYIWITMDTVVPSPTATPVAPTPTPAFDCSTFIITLSSTSPTIDSCDIFGVNSQGTTNTTLVPDPTATPILIDPTATPVPNPTATPVIGSGPTSTPVPDPTATPIINPTSTPVPNPTATPVQSADALINSSNVDLEIWYDASDVTTITPAGVEGTLVTQWSDKSALAHNATPTGGSAKPVYDEMSINGLNSLYFDGTDGMSVSPLGQLANSTEATVFVAFSPLQSSNFTLLDSDANFNVNIDAQGKYVISAGGGSYRSFNRVGFGSQIFSFRYNSDPIEVNSLNGFKLLLDGSQDAGTYLTTPAAGGNLGNIGELFIGQNSTLANRYNGYIGEILVFNKALSDIEMNTVMNNLRTKWSAWSLNSLLFTGSNNSAFDNIIRWKDQILSTPEQDPLNTQREITGGTGTWYTQSTPGSTTAITSYIERTDGGQWNDESELAILSNVSNITFTKTLIQPDLIQVDIQYTAVSVEQIGRLRLDETNSVW